MKLLLKYKLSYSCPTFIPICADAHKSKQKSIYGQLLVLVTIKKNISEIFECSEDAQSTRVINQMTPKDHGNVTLSSNVSGILVYFYGSVLVTHTYTQTIILMIPYIKKLPTCKHLM